MTSGNGKGLIVDQKFFLQKKELSLRPDCMPLAS